MAIGSLSGIPASRQPRTCFACEQVFYRHSSAGRDAGKCCSRECGYEWLRLKKAIIKPVVFRTFRRKPAQAPQRRCPGCSAALDKWKHFCDLCRDARGRESRARSRLVLKDNGTKAAHRKARKLKLRCATVETVNPIKVLDRDRWRCQLCGVATPRRLRGSYDDRAPEVDHIIPLSKGGDHSYANVQCACRRCNLMKAANPLGQMRLFG